MSVYTDGAATALRLLKKYGIPVTLSRTTGGSIDPVTGAITAGTDASKTPTGLFVNFPVEMIDGTRIQAGDKRLIMAADVTPLTTDTVPYGGYTWIVHSVETVSPTGVDIVHFVHIRR